MSRKGFLSYAHEDWRTAERLVRYLAASGCSVWFDRERRNEDEVLDEQLFNAIRESYYFLLLLTPVSISKQGYIRREIALALRVVTEFEREGSFIIPILAEPCDSSCDRFLALGQAVDLTQGSWSKGVDSLVSRLNASMPTLANATAHEFQVVLSEQQALRDLAAELRFGSSIAEHLAKGLARLRALAPEVQSKKVQNAARDMRAFADCLEMLYFRGGAQVDIWGAKAVDPKARCHECGARDIVHGHYDLGGVDIYDSYFSFCRNCFWSWYREEHCCIGSEGPVREFNYACNTY
jgi:hypothetical protein